MVRGLNPITPLHWGANLNSQQVNEELKCPAVQKTHKHCSPLAPGPVCETDPAKSSNTVFEICAGYEQRVISVWKGLCRLLKQFQSPADFKQPMEKYYPS